jgi:hypothetical protein
MLISSTLRLAYPCRVAIMTIATTQMQICLSLTVRSCSHRCIVQYILMATPSDLCLLGDIILNSIQMIKRCFNNEKLDEKISLPSKPEALLLGRFLSTSKKVECHRHLNIWLKWYSILLTNGCKWTKPDEATWGCGSRTNYSSLSMGFINISHNFWALCKVFRRYSK